MSVKPIEHSQLVPVKSTPSEIERSAAVAASVAKRAEEVQGQQPVKVTRKDAENIAEVMNKLSQLFNQQLSFEVFEDTNQLYVQIVDRNTKEVIKQIPPQEMLELSAKIKEMVGIILDKYA